MNIPSFSILLLDQQTHSRLRKILGRLGYSDLSSPQNFLELPVTTGVAGRLQDYKTVAADLLVPPELIATNDIFTQHKNLLEFCRRFHNGEPVERAALDTTLDTLLETVLVLSVLADERCDG